MAFLVVGSRLQRRRLGQRRRRGSQVSGSASSVGSHILGDFYGVAADLLRDAQSLESLLRRAARSAGARVLDSRFHTFGTGQGVTGVVLLAESHLSIHTWPETGFAAADIFMCGRASAQTALEVLLKSLSPARHHSDTFERGERSNEQDRLAVR
jgi:S-adenosylmethionine decarboxylase